MSRFIYAEALELIDFHLAQRRRGLPRLERARGDRRALRRAAGHDRGHLLYKPPSTSNGKFTGEMEFFALGRQQGPGYSASWPSDRGIDLAESSAYSDSETDVPMLEAVGHPYAVNPDRVLASSHTSTSGPS